MEKLPVTYNSKEIPIWVKYWFSKKLSRKVSEILTGQSSYILENTLYKRFKKFEVGGNIEQTQYEGKNKVNIYGENAFKYGSGALATTVNTKGVIVTTSNFAGTRNKGILIENLQNNTDYVASLICDSIVTESSHKYYEIEAIGYNADNTYNNLIKQAPYNTIGSVVEFKFNSGNYDKVAIHISGYYNGGETGTLTYHNLMVEEGTTATDYEPFVGRNTKPKPTV